MISYLSATSDISQFKPDYIILKAGLLGNCSQAPRIEAREVTTGKSIVVGVGGWGVREEKGHAQREKRRERERKRPKYLDYIEESLLEKGSPVPELERSELWAEYAR